MDSLAIAFRSFASRSASSNDLRKAGFSEVPASNSCSSNNLSRIFSFKEANESLATMVVVLNDSFHWHIKSSTASCTCDTTKPPATGSLNFWSPFRLLLMASSNAFLRFRICLFIFVSVTRVLSKGIFFRMFSNGKSSGPVGELVRCKAFRFFTSLPEETCFISCLTGVIASINHCLRMMRPPADRKRLMRLASFLDSFPSSFCHS